METMVETEETFTPLPLEDIVAFWVFDGIVPVFLGTVDDICKHAEAYGFQIYYVIATEKYKVQVNDNYSKTEERPQIFKVNNTIVGKSIVPAGDDLKLAKLEANAWFTLPSIPFYLVQKLDDFFRLVEDKYGTESIVILTYDMTKTGPEGWGAVVPTQTNTSMDCDYDPTSIIELLPEGVQQVGSAHSHPNMSAYASGTDHKDQASFDGIHITYGWQKHVNNGITQYHIELQSGGKSFVFNADQVFEAFPGHEPEADVQEWAEKVSKKSGVITSGGKTNTGSQGYQGYTPPGISSTANPAKNVKLPPGCPDTTKVIVIGVLGEADDTCPFCETRIISIDLKKRRCMSCHMYIAIDGEELADIVQARKDAGVYTQDIDVTRNTANQPIVFWRRNGHGGHTYDKVFEPQGK